MQQQQRRRTGAKKRPNVVLIMADDLGFSDVGCFGSEIETPNIDELGANGILFTQMYNCARCCPSRASLLTGLYPHRLASGIWCMILVSIARHIRDICAMIVQLLQRYCEMLVDTR